MSRYLFTSGELLNTGLISIETGGYTKRGDIIKGDNHDQQRLHPEILFLCVCVPENMHYVTTIGTTSTHL